MDEDGLLHSKVSPRSNKLVGGKDFRGEGEAENERTQRWLGMADASISGEPPLGTRLSRAGGIEQWLDKHGSLASLHWEG